MMLDESEVQAAVVKHLTTRPAPGLVWFHVPNGGWRQHTEAARFVGLGLKAGVSDLILLYDAKFFALEIKAGSKSRVSPSQRKFLEDVRQAGGVAEIGRGLDACLAILERWKLLRGRVA